MTLATFAALLGCTPEAAVPDAGSPDSAENLEAVPLLDGGLWQEFRLPDAWVSQHLSGMDARRVVVRLRPPHPGDYAAFTPCTPPPQVRIGVVNTQGAFSETLIACPYACQDGSEGEELWGYRTHLLGVELGLLRDGTLDLAAHYRRRSDDPTPGGESRFSPPTIGEERVRHHRITPEQIRAALRRGQAVETCQQLLDPA